MKVEIIPVTPFQQNCSLLVCERTKKAAVIDPGGDLDLIRDAVMKRGVELEKILLTHGHIDHCGGTAQLSRELGLPVEGPHIEDRFLIDNLPQQGVRFGLPHLEGFTPARWLLGGDTVRFGQVELQVRHCPGHTPGHVIFSAPSTVWLWWVMCYSPVRSAVPTFPARRSRHAYPFHSRAALAAGRGCDLHSRSRADFDLR